MGGGGAGGGRERLDSVRATPPAHTPKFPHTSTHPPPPPPSHQVLQGRAPGRGQAAQGQGGVPRDVRRRVMRGVQDVAPRLRQWAARHRIPTIPPPPPSPRKLHCPSPEKTLSLPLNPPTPHPTARPEFAPPTVHHQDPPPLSAPCYRCPASPVCTCACVTLIDPHSVAGRLRGVGEAHPRAHRAAAAACAPQPHGPLDSRAAAIVPPTRHTRSTHAMLGARGVQPHGGGVAPSRTSASALLPARPPAGRSSRVSECR